MRVRLDACMGSGLTGTTEAILRFAQDDAQRRLTPHCLTPRRTAWHRAVSASL